ncbi:hypothetical protein Sjap_014349 [Stephania japonica]|uniref:DUF7356 domain-containing protein n=1 Tax=Stephania japonica TaxID=461633 RepID=A0AAP0NYK4_9MAGN
MRFSWLRSARMDGRGSIAVILLLFIFVKPSDASLLGSYRRMIAVMAGMKNSDAQIPPSPSPVPVGISDNSGGNRNRNPSQDQRANPNDLDNNDTSGNVEKGLPKEGNDEKCPVLSKKCDGGKKVVACIKHYNGGSQELYVLVQNDGESNLTVVLTSVSATISPKELEIPKHEDRKFNVTLTSNTGESPEIVLKAGDCEIRFRPSPTTPGGQFSQWIPSYAYQVTPVYGAYLAFLILLVAGGTWACCKFGKRGRRTDGGIPYQELEMGLPGSGTGTNVETADGWDQDWDDDWDEEKAVKSPGGQHSRSVSANGLTSRTPNKEGWENGWDE